VTQTQTQSPALNVLWLDDELKVFETTSHQIKEVFQKHSYDVNIHPYTEVDGFLGYYKNYKHQIDFIFLDIGLGENSNTNGLEIYKDIRESNPNIVIVFVSGKLQDPLWKSKVEEYQKSDENLFTIAKGFPSKRQSDDFLNKVITPILEIIKHAEKKLLNLTLKELIELNSADKQKNIDRLNIYLQRKHKNNASEFSFATNPISTDLIPAQILEVEENRVLLNCLLDEKEEQYQLRKFDREPLNGAVILEPNHIIIIEIQTFEGERKFLFRDGEAKLKKHFEHKKYFDGEKDYSAFLSPKTSE